MTIQERGGFMHTRNSGRTFFQTGSILLIFLFSTLLYAQSPAKKDTKTAKTVKNKPSPAKNLNIQKAGKQVKKKKQSIKKIVLICDFCKNCPDCTARRAELKKQEQLAKEKKAREKAELAAKKAEMERLALLPATPIDKILVENWEKNSLAMPAVASDEVFFRRAMLNVTGRIPSVKEVTDFLKNKDKDKRKKLIDTLLDSDGYVNVMTMRFADMLRIKSEFPINLWPNAVQAYHRQIYGDLKKDRSYKEMAKDMLTSSGSNFRFPYANFFRGSANRQPEGLAKVAALTFMGIRTEKMKEEDLKKFTAFFSRIRYKSTAEWKEEIVYTDPLPCTVKARTPDGENFTIDSPLEDPREVFAQWLLSDDNPYFARAFVNRLWHYYFGRGLIHPADDMPLVPVSKFKRFFGTEEENCVNTELLEYLADEFRKSGYSIKHISRLILNSKAYQAPSVPLKKENYEKEVKYFATYPPRRMEAEIIVDMLGTTIGMRERYMSVIPEPFTYVPSGRPTVLIDDGSITSGLLDKFGRPSRDSGELSERKNIATDAQRLYLMNSSRLYNATRNYGQNVSRWTKKNPSAGINEIYLRLLSRYPLKKEKEILLKKLPPSRSRHFNNTYTKFCQDLVWALVNTKEFLYYH